MRRPSDRVSSIDTSSATRIGSCQGSTTTIEPSDARRGPPRHVGEELQHVGAHRVVGEVVLDAPDRLEPERLGEIGEPELARDRPRGPRARVPGSGRWRPCLLACSSPFSVRRGRHLLRRTCPWCVRLYADRRGRGKGRGSDTVRRGARNDDRERGAGAAERRRSRRGGPSGTGALADVDPVGHRRGRRAARRGRPGDGAPRLRRSGADLHPHRRARPGLRRGLEQAGHRALPRGELRGRDRRLRGDPRPEAPPLRGAVGPGTLPRGPRPAPRGRRALPPHARGPSPPRRRPPQPPPHPRRGGERQRPRHPPRRCVSVSPPPAGDRGGSCPRSPAPPPTGDRPPSTGGPSRTASGPRRRPGPRAA